VLVLVLLSTVAAVGMGAAPSYAEASTSENLSTSLAEDFSYQGQGQVNDVRLVSGDGNIVQVDCAAGLISVRTGAGADSEVCFQVLGLPGNIKMEVPAVTEIRGDGHDIVALIGTEGAFPSSIHMTSATSTPVVGATTDTVLQLNAATPSSPAKPSIRWPNWDVNNLPVVAGSDIRTGRRSRARSTARKSARGRARWARSCITAVRGRRRSPRRRCCSRPVTRTISPATSRPRGTWTRPITR